VPACSTPRAWVAFGYSVAFGHGLTTSLTGAGALAERTRFWPWLVFVAAWVTIVYLPLAYWVFDPHGWMVSRLHLLDFAGGTAVEVNSGAASLVLAMVLGKRLGWPR